MTRRIYDLSQDISGDAYRKLLVTASEYCDTFLLVVRKSVRMTESAEQVLDKLQPFLLQQTEESEWPGTRLFGRSATVFRLRLNHSSSAILMEATDSLYSWLQPALPEDLCLLRSDGSPWLTSITHEKDAYLELSPDEYKSLCEAVPELVGIITVPDV